VRQERIEHVGPVRGRVHEVRVDPGRRRPTRDVLGDARRARADRAHAVGEVAAGRRGVPEEARLAHVDGVVSGEPGEDTVRGERRQARLATRGVEELVQAARDAGGVLRRLGPHDDDGAAWWRRARVRRQERDRLRAGRAIGHDLEAVLTLRIEHDVGGEPAHARQHEHPVHASVGSRDEDTRVGEAGLQAPGEDRHRPRPRLDGEGVDRRRAPDGDERQDPRSAVGCEPDPAVRHGRVARRWRGSDA
jgi:hypothetical protein